MILSDKISSVILLVVSLLFVSSWRDCSAIEHKMLSEGGPYVCKGRGEIEKFTAEISIPAEMEKTPVWITLYNGYGNRPGFSWVRVFLSSGAAEGEAGEILADERTFLSTHAKTIDLTGHLSSTRSRITVEGSGSKGAIFSWVLTAAPSSSIHISRMTKITPGQSFMISGSGFDLNASRNQVMLNGKPVRVDSVGAGFLKAEAPSDFDGKQAVVSVESNGERSNSLAVALGQAPPHLISMSPYGGPVGTILTIRGANFSRLARNNVVKIGPYNAEVFKVLDSGTLLCYVPMWSGYTTLPVTVIVNGVRSDNQLTFWCTPHLYGGDPDAAGYAND